MIPPQVNGATHLGFVGKGHAVTFPMIPPQVNGATCELTDRISSYLVGKRFPMIPPQVNGATSTKSALQAEYDRLSFQ